MNIELARKICGNQPKWALRNMAKALSMFSFSNTEEENLRLKAAKLILRSK